MNQKNTPPRVAPRLKAAPKIRNLYWCDFPEDAQLPEFWKRRPVIIVSRKRTLHGTVTVIPCSTDPQDDNEWAVNIKRRLINGLLGLSVINHAPLRLVVYCPIQVLSLAYPKMSLLWYWANCLNGCLRYQIAKLDILYVFAYI